MDMLSVENLNVEVMLKEEDIKKEKEEEVYEMTGIHSNIDTMVKIEDIKIEEEEKFDEIYGDSIKIKIEEEEDVMFLTEDLLNKLHEQIEQSSSMDIMDYSQDPGWFDSSAPVDHKVVNEYVKIYGNKDESYFLTNNYEINHIKIENDLDIDYEPIIGLGSENFNIAEEAAHIKIERCDSPLMFTTQETGSNENLAENHKKNYDNLCEKPDLTTRSKKAKKCFEPPKLKQAGRDIFCWKCHKFSEDVILCTVCPRVYHKKCIKKILENTDGFKTWICDECDNINSVKSILGLNDLSILAKMLSYVIVRLRNCQQSIYFETKVDSSLYPDYQNYVVNPMYISLLEKNVNSKKYINCEAFLADVKWILHNSYIFNSASSKITTAARGIVRAAVNDCCEIITCPECYMHANTLSLDKWFIEPCSDPHLLVWAKLQGYPYWPGKLMSIKDNKVDIRFFGDHNKSIIPLESCYLYSQMRPTKAKYCPSLELAIKESQIHISLLEEKFVKFYYAPIKTKLNNDLGMFKKLQFPVLFEDPSYLAFFNSCNDYNISSQENLDSYGAPLSNSEMDPLESTSECVYKSTTNNLNSLLISDAFTLNNEILPETKEENFIPRYEPKIFPKPTMDSEAPHNLSHLKQFNCKNLNSHDLLEHSTSMTNNVHNIPSINLKLLFPEKTPSFTSTTIVPRDSDTYLSVSSDLYNVSSRNLSKLVKCDKDIPVSISTRKMYKNINFEKIAASVETKPSKNSNYDTFTVEFISNESNALRDSKPICIPTSQVKPTSKSNFQVSQKNLSSLQKNIPKNSKRACHIPISLTGKYNRLNRLISTPSAADYYCVSKSPDNSKRNRKPNFSPPEILTTPPKNLQVEQNPLSNSTPYSFAQNVHGSGYRLSQCRAKNILVKEESELKNISSCRMLKNKMADISSIKSDDFSGSSSFKSSPNEDVEKRKTSTFSGTKSLKKNNESQSKKFSGCSNQTQIEAFIDKLKNNKSATKSSLINELLELKRNILDDLKKNIRGGGFEKKVKLAMDTRKKVIVNYKNNILRAKRSVWCKVCGKKADFYCCNGAYYCSQSCQDCNFQSHQKNCIQSEMKISDKYLRLNLRNRQIVKTFSKNHVRKKYLTSR